MEERSKNGHRQRMRDTYKSVGIDGMDDAKVLELYLSLVIPRKDVRELSYRLINAFGSLRGVFSADVTQLMMVDGVGENTAVLISLCSDIQNRIGQDDGNNNLQLNSASKTIEYASSRLSALKQEKMLIIALDNNSGIINTTFIKTGGVNFLDANPNEILRFLLYSNASGVVIAHNHPNGDCEPSNSDIYFNYEFMELMRKVEIQFLDHIVVGIDGAVSMRQGRYNDKLFENPRGVAYESIND